MIDVNVFLGAYPFRRVPATSPEAVLAAMDRLEIAEAWATHLPSLFWKDPAEGSPWLYDLHTRHPRFRPVPVVHPGLPGWEDDLREAVDRGAPVVRADPGYLGLPAGGREMCDLVEACGESGMPLLAAVRLEDGRGRHPLDVAPELTPAAVRSWVRRHPSVRLVITHADRSFIEEVHFGAAPAEAARIWWDISWIWGPPEDHLALLLHTVGLARFVFGTGQPLRLPEAAIARLDLLALSPEARTGIESEHARSLTSGSRTVP